MHRKILRLAACALAAIVTLAPLTEGAGRSDGGEAAGAGARGDKGGAGGNAGGR